jgi:ribosome-associated translation inhibitor RaiA
MDIRDKFPNVKLVKFPEIDEVDLAFFEKSLEKFFSKVGTDATLQLSLKDYAKGGLRVQHEVHGTLKIGSKSFFAEEEGWKLFEAIANVLTKLTKETMKASKKGKV